ncbi:MAG: Gfo/Idh/MocA family protein [Candidatus Zipacnadales bacterium]
MNEPLGIAMLGTTHAHAQGKMEVLRKSPSWRVIGVCEPNPEAQQVIRQTLLFKDLTWFTPEELLAHPDVIAVVVEGDVAENLTLGWAVIEAGKHLHLEKPAGTEFAGPQKLLKTAHSQGLFVQLGYMFRYNPAFQFLFQAVERGWLGDIFSVRGRLNTTIPSERRPALGRFAGGIMFELGCHLLDAVVRLLGRPNGVTGFCRHDLDLPDNLADNTVAVLEYENAIAVIETAAMESDPFPQRRFEVYGTKGSVVIHPLEPPRLFASFMTPPPGHPSHWHEIEIRSYRRYVDDFEELAECIRQGKPLSYSIDHELAVQQTLLQACGMDKA